MTNLGELILRAIKKEIDTLQSEHRFDFDGRHHWQDVVSNDYEYCEVMGMTEKEYYETEEKYYFLSDLYYA